MSRGLKRPTNSTLICSLSRLDCIPPNIVGSSSRQLKNSSLVVSANDKDLHAHSSVMHRYMPPPAGNTHHEKISSEKAADHLITRCFDICLSKSGSQFALKPSLGEINKEKWKKPSLSERDKEKRKKPSLSERNKEKRKKRSLSERNKEKRKEVECSKRSEILNLRQGMVLLKKYISHGNQIKIIKKCQELGLGPGGFYQPSFRGGRLRVPMMCLGMDWNAQTGLYTNCRSIDGACPPCIPDEFKLLVEEAIRESLAFIKKDSKRSNVERVLPMMSPDLCIVNFYEKDGKLGLHQDKDESKESLRRGLPIVSFSIGDSAEFLYGDNREIRMAKKVVLESGDVLIFGGASRLVFHGVSRIMENSAPSFLVEKATFVLDV